MPRGRKKAVQLTVEEKIAALEKELQALRETVEATEAELKNLQETRNQELVHTLMDAIAESGKSIQDVIKIVKGE